MLRGRTIRLTEVVMTATAILLLISYSSSVYTHGQDQVIINGAGATFPLPLIDTWREKFQVINPSVTINFQPIGSGGGVKQFIEKKIDFGATDAPLTQEEEKQISSDVVHIPETVGSVVAAYNLPGLPANALKLTGPILADIFLGKITKWNDTEIQSINSDISLPYHDIVVIHRSDSSGTTFVWTDYLSNISSIWNQQIGNAKSIKWPVGVGMPGNEGVANMIENTTNSIGYVELAYALNTGMNYASIQNKEGNFIKPSIKTTSAAVRAGSLLIPATGNQSWSNISIVNVPGPESYPIASFSYLLLYKDLGTNIAEKQKAQKLVDFISWALNEGQIFGPHLGYMPTPKEVGNLNLETLQSLTFKGDPMIVRSATG
jgi:phosphate transport system substrate-binding protein